MNLEEFREYCLSLGEVEEKLPFAKMPGGDSVLVFYVSGHTFCYCDLNDLRVVVKCQPERIPELLGTANGVEPPDNHFNSKYWIGINLQTIDNELLQELVRNSFEIVKGKYEKKAKKQSSQN
ncbi:MAG: MmcQ/YjbR family DNA-binding protein, partial [Bacteroidales bacterium]|nr:MmcQ/YjbR family DNA-binding protein [Bacteroidales bacterium]